MTASVEEWKRRYETARLAHEEARAEIERLRQRVDVSTMFREAQPCLPPRRRRIPRWAMPLATSLLFMLALGTVLAILLGGCQAPLR